MRTSAFLVLACLAALSATGCYTTGTASGQQVSRLGAGGNSREILLPNGRITRLRLRPTSWVRFILSDGTVTR